MHLGHCYFIIRALCSEMPKLTVIFDDDSEDSLLEWEPVSPPQPVATLAVSVRSQSPAAAEGSAVRSQTPVASGTETIADRRGDTDDDRHYCLWSVSCTGGPGSGVYSGQ